MKAKHFLIMGALLFSQIETKADEVKLMVKGRTAGSQILENFKGARSSIDIMTYIWDPCSSVSKLFLEELQRKAAAGVKVRLLIDSHTHDSKLRQNFTAYLAGKNIEIRYFNVRLKYSPTNNHRMHAKLMVVDGKTYFSGGRNIANDYFDLEYFNWLDRDVNVKGSSAARAQAAFNTYWNSYLSTRVRPSSKAEATQWAGECLKIQDRDANIMDWYKENSKAVVQESKVHQCQNIDVLIDKPDFYIGVDPNDDGRSENASRFDVLNDKQFEDKHVTRELVDFIDQSDRLWIENYSYVPDGRLRQVLDKKRDQGTTIEVFTNSVSDSGILRHLMAKDMKRDQSKNQIFYPMSLLGSFSLAWEMTVETSANEKPQWSVHSKTFVSGTKDHRPQNAFVSSFNIDPRSYHTNSESAVLIKGCPSLATETVRSMHLVSDAYVKDLQDCEACRKKPDSSMMTKILAFWGRGFY